MPNESIETVKFLILVTSHNLCNIVSDDYRQKFRDLADGACLTSLDAMIDEMEYLTKKCAEIGVSAIFEIRVLKTR